MQAFDQYVGRPAALRGQIHTDHAAAAESGPDEHNHGTFGQPTGGVAVRVRDQALATVPTECSENVQLRGANLAAALPTDLSTFRYDGSLTTDPYTEPVSWLVLNHIREIKSTSLAHFQSRFPDGDSRPLQPLNGRTVTYRPQH